jgi:hypothetical protein
MIGRSLARFSAEPTIVENASNERCRAVCAFASQPTYTSANNAVPCWDVGLDCSHSDHRSDM